MNSYEARRQARIDRLHERAERATRAGEAATSHASERARMIPFGQPILVGHHSERRDRNFRSKISRGFDKGRELSDKGAELERRANAAEANTAIRSDNPEAPTLLRDKVAKLEAQRDRMKLINKAIRSMRGALKRNSLIAPETSSDEINARVLSELVKCGTISQDEAASIARTYAIQPYHGLGIPAYALTNLGATIRTAKKRAEEEEQRAAAIASGAMKVEKEERDGITIWTDPSENRILIEFPAKPDEETRRRLKSYGWRWMRSAYAWVRYLHTAGARPLDRAREALGWE